MNANPASAEGEDAAELTRKQSERVFLRQRFLQFLLKTAFKPDGHPVDIVLHEGDFTVYFAMHSK